MDTEQFHLLLADDDQDDCEIFREALEEIVSPVRFSSVQDGQHLMDWLNDPKNALPDVLFLDMKMPRKNGLECLEEIRRNPALQSLPVVIYATSVYFQPMEELYRLGALYYVQKPAVFEHLLEIIKKTMFLCRQSNGDRREFQGFIIRDGFREEV